MTLRALASESGSILVFLPGMGEIRRVAEILHARVRRPDVDIAPLYGALDARAQDLAIAAPKPGRRKIVLATSIAETSLTIEGVRVVIDSGLMRVPIYEPDVGLTRLETVRVSRANADQRRGRAGRVEPGVCYRLWEEAATGGLQPYAAPEILSADLSGFALDCALWGVADPATLRFLDPPPRAALAEAQALLKAIGALDGDGRITDEGRAISRLALPPRLARMVVDAARAGDARTASEVAIVLTERGLGGDSVDLATRLEAFRRDRSPRADDARRLARGLAARALTSAPLPEGEVARAPTLLPPREKVAGEAGRMRRVGALLASAYPDRIAIARGKRGEFLMANGRAAAVEAHDPLAREPFLAIGEIAGRAASARILLAAPLSLGEIERIAGASIETMDELTFDRAVRVLAGAAPAPARRARARRADAGGSAGRGGRAGAGARRAVAWARAPAVERTLEAMARPDHVPAPGRRRAVARPFRRGACRRSRLAGAVPHRQDPPGRDRRRRPPQCARGASFVGSQAPPRRRGADPLPRADRDRGADRLRSRRRAGDCAAGAGAVRAQRASVAGPAGASRSRSSCFRPPIARSRSRATCRASGAAPGPPSAPTSAAATPAISGPRTRPAPRRPRGRSRGGREGGGRAVTLRKTHSNG